MCRKFACLGKYDYWQMLQDLCRTGGGFGLVEKSTKIFFSDFDAVK